MNISNYIKNTVIFGETRKEIVELDLGVLGTLLLFHISSYISDNRFTRVLWKHCAIVLFFLT